MSGAPTIIEPTIQPTIQPTGAAPTALGVDDLRELMRAFNATTERLEQTHVTLQTEVGRLKSELAEANAQLRRSRDLAALGEMAAGIAHEIRNALGPIRLEVQMLAEDVDPAGGEMLGRIDRGVGSIEAIVRDMLRFARDTTIMPVPTSARELAHAGALTCEALVADTGIELRLDVPDDRDAALAADACLLTQAVGNVVRNAADALAESGAEPRRITITADHRTMRCPDGRTAPRIVLAVEDTGPGIPDDVVARMFNPFFTTRATGTGLGLAIVHRIVDAHGGHIRVNNVEPHGARVELCLPASPESTPARTNDQHSRAKDGS